MTEINKRFLTNSDETGRFIVKSLVTGITYYVEPIDNSGRPADWGSYNPSTGNIEHKKGFDKYTGSVTESESLITEENGFSNVTTLPKGYSPMSEIERRDKEYELKYLNNESN